jgi:hypothetical protein
LFDILARKRAPRTAGAQARAGAVADTVVESALADLRTIRELDRDLAAPAPGEAGAPDEPFDEDLARSMRHLYETWAQDAERLLARVADVVAGGRQVRGVQQLGHEHGRVMAMLSVSLEDIAEGKRQLAEGHGVPAGEVRGILAQLRR